MSSKVTEEVIEIEEMSPVRVPRKVCKDSEVKIENLDRILSVNENIKDPKNTAKVIDASGQFTVDNKIQHLKFKVIYPDTVEVNDTTYKCVIVDSPDTTTVNIIVDPARIQWPINPFMVFKIIIEYSMVGSERIIGSIKSYNVVDSLITNFESTREEVLMRSPKDHQDQQRENTRDLAENIIASKNNFVLIKFTNGLNNGVPRNIFGFLKKAAYGLMTFYKPMNLLEPGDTFYSNADCPGNICLSTAKKFKVIKITRDQHADTIKYVTEYSTTSSVTFIKDQFGRYMYFINGGSRWIITGAN